LTISTLHSDAVDPAPTAGTKSDIPPGYKTPTKMVGLNSGAVNPRTGTLMKLSDLRGASTSLIVAPKGGGLWHDDDPKSLVPFVGFDPDVSVNVFTWSDEDQDWVCPTFDPVLGVRQGPSHTLQFRPKGIKDIKKTEQACTTLPDSIVFNGLKAPSADHPPMKTRTYVELVRRACIQRGFFNEFVVPDAHNPAGNDLFKKHSRFSILQIKEHVANQRLTCDPYAETNYVWSGTLLLSTLHQELYAKVIQEVGVSPSGPEVFIATMKEVHNGAHYEQMEQLKASFKLLKLTFQVKMCRTPTRRSKISWTSWMVLICCLLVTIFCFIRSAFMNSLPASTCVSGPSTSTTKWKPLSPAAVSWILPHLLLCLVIK
jgi:hypothetical protein